MTGAELYKAGRLDDAIQAVGAELRDDPADARRRTFLFELLCFTGNLDRAEKQLDVLAGGGKAAEMGALLYRSALHADRTRRAMFESGRFPLGGREPSPVSGRLNGAPFRSLTDADPRIGARLEVYAAGQYTWIPFEQLASVRIQQPVRLRDLLWATAIVRTVPHYTGAELGEVLLPVMTPLAWRSGDDAVRLGRATAWEELDGGVQIPVGQKLWLVDDEEIPILEVRELEVDAKS